MLSWHVKFSCLQYFTSKPSSRPAASACWILYSMADLANLAKSCFQVLLPISMYRHEFKNRNHIHVQLNKRGNIPITLSTLCSNLNAYASSHHTTNYFVCLTYILYTGCFVLGCSIPPLFSFAVLIISSIIRWTCMNITMIPCDNIISVHMLPHAHAHKS